MCAKLPEGRIYSSHIVTCKCERPLYEGDISVHGGTRKNRKRHVGPVEAVLYLCDLGGADRVPSFCLFFFVESGYYQ